MTTLDAAHRALDDVALEFGRLAAVQGAHDRSNGTGPHEYGRQAQQAAQAARRALCKSKLTWRHMLAERYWGALAQSDNGQLRRALISLAAHALLWAAAIDRRRQPAAPTVAADDTNPQPSGAPSPAPENPHHTEQAPPCP